MQIMIFQNSKRTIAGRIFFFMVFGCLVSTVSLASGQEVLLFSSARSGNGDIYGRIQDSIKPIIRSAAADGTVRFDKQRNRIVHHRFIDDVAYLYSRDQKVMKDPNGESAPVWSPSGEHLVYVNPKDQKLYISNIKDDLTRPLTTGFHIDRYPCFSPDGTRVAFARQVNSQWDLYEVEIKGDQPSEIRRLTKRRKYVGHPAWSPDGTKLAFDTDYEGDTEIAVLDLATGVVTRLTRRPGNDLVPSWSLDGSRLAFAGEPKDTNNWDVWEMSLDEPEKLERVTTAAGYDGAPIYVPLSSIQYELKNEN